MDKIETPINDIDNSMNDILNHIFDNIGEENNVNNSTEINTEKTDEKLEMINSENVSGTISENNKESAFIDMFTIVQPEVSEAPEILIQDVLNIEEIIDEDEEDEYGFADMKNDIVEQNILRNFSGIFRDKREKLGLDKKAFSKQLGISKKTVGKIELAEHDFELSELIALCTKLDIDISVSFSPARKVF